MVKHIVMWKLKNNLDKENTAVEIKNKLEGLQGRIDGLLHIEVGIDFSQTDASADVMLYSEFADAEALSAYQTHPEHVAIAGFVKSVAAERRLVDYTI